MAVIKRKPAVKADEPTQPEPRGVTAHDALVQVARRWLVTTRRCSTVQTELRAFTGTGECPDAVGWRSDYSILVECKVSRSDFLADRKKHFRASPEKGIGTYRFYLCPAEIIKADDLPVGWGLLYEEKGRVRQIVGPVGNAWSHGENRAFIHQRNMDAEITMLVSALRRTES